MSSLLFVPVVINASEIATNVSGNDCVTNGVCTREDIINDGKGLAIEVKVNDNETKKFYVINDNGSDLDLILDRNSSNIVEWNADGTSKNGPSSEFLNQLKKDTSSWTNISDRTDSYSLRVGTIDYTIDYNGYKARLITAEEINKITGNTATFDYSNKDSYYLDTASSVQSSTCKDGNTSGCKYGWLYDHISRTCKAYGCLNNSEEEVYGYFTATAFNNVYGYDKEFAFRVSNIAALSTYMVNGSSQIGIRPVITISKSMFASQNEVIKSNPDTSDLNTNILFILSGFLIVFIIIIVKKISITEV